MFGTCASLSFAQPDEKLCPERLATFEVGSSAAFAHERARFEVRRCEGLVIQLAGFGDEESVPSLLITTGSSAISTTIQTGDILLVQLSAGSSHPTYIFKMIKGSPILVERIDSIGSIQFREEYEEIDDYVIFIIPLKTYVKKGGKIAKKPPRVLRLNKWGS